MVKKVRLSLVFMYSLNLCVSFLRHVSDGEKSRAAEENIFL